MVGKFYVTTPIYYANSDPHIGSAYTTIAADILSRWNKLNGKKTFFLTGTDEHGQKIQQTAEDKGKNPKEFVDEIALKFKKVFKQLNIENDNFVRTTDDYHEKEVKQILQELYNKKRIYKGEYEAYYCVGCEQYLTKGDLVNGKCPLHKTEPELRKEEAYLFKLSSFQNKLLKLIETGKYEILPIKKRNEVLSFIKKGLTDISISRKKEKVYWGIELPFDKDHTSFVWVDAFWNYVSGLRVKGKFSEFWPADVQLMANDILRVHATIWPALLLGLNYKLPKTLFIHGYFTVNGQKMSKSLGNVISPEYLVKEYGADSVRYFLMRNISFGQDGDFSEKALVDRHNNELLNKLGNLVSRTTGLIERNGITKCRTSLNINFSKIKKLIDNFEFDKALNEIFSFIDKCNLYVQTKKPWETKDKKVLYELAGAIKQISILLSPFIPETCEKIAKQLNFEVSIKEFEKPFNEKAKIVKGDYIFKKIEFNEDNKDVKIADKKINKDVRIKEIMQGLAQINFEDWSKLDLRVTKITKVEDIKDADKLYKMTLDLGKEKRIVCAGLKQYYSKDELKGLKVILLSNLAPRKIRGIESYGMLLAAATEDEKKVVLIGPTKDIEVGSRVS